MKKFIAFAILFFLTLAAYAGLYETVGSDGTPTTSACGTGNGSVSGTDQLGVITLGTVAVTSCTLNFSTTLSVAPKCIITADSGTTVPFITSISTSAMVLGLTVSLPSGHIYYYCGIK